MHRYYKIIFLNDLESWSLIRHALGSERTEIQYLRLRIALHDCDFCWKVETGAYSYRWRSLIYVTGIPFPVCVIYILFFLYNYTIVCGFVCVCVLYTHHKILFNFINHAVNIHRSAFSRQPESIFLLAWSLSRIRKHLRIV